jgi:hypothetical protein
MFSAPGLLLYGTITVAALLAAESARHETYLETVGAVAVVMVLHWLAHSYATLMERRIEGRERLQLRTAGQTAGHELPILSGAMLPLLAVPISWAAGARLRFAVSVGSGSRWRSPANRGSCRAKRQTLGCRSGDPDGVRGHPRAADSSRLS